MTPGTRAASAGLNPSELRPNIMRVSMQQKQVGAVSGG